MAMFVFVVGPGGRILGVSDVEPDKREEREKATRKVKRQETGLHIKAFGGPNSKPMRARKVDRYLSSLQTFSEITSHEKLYTDIHVPFPSELQYI